MLIQAKTFLLNYSSQELLPCFLATFSMTIPAISWNTGPVASWLVILFTHFKYLNFDLTIPYLESKNGEEERKGRYLDWMKGFEDMWRVLLGIQSFLQIRICRLLFVDQIFKTFCPFWSKDRAKYLFSNMRLSLSNARSIFCSLRIKSKQNLKLDREFLL